MHPLKKSFWFPADVLYRALGTDLLSARCPGTRAGVARSENRNARAGHRVDPASRDPGPRVLRAPSSHGRAARRAERKTDAWGTPDGRIPSRAPSLARWPQGRAPAGSPVERRCEETPVCPHRGEPSRRGGCAKVIVTRAILPQGGSPAGGSRCAGCGTRKPPRSPRATRGAPMTSRLRYGRGDRSSRTVNPARHGCRCVGSRGLAFQAPSRRQARRRIGDPSRRGSPHGAGPPSEGSRSSEPEGSRKSDLPTPRLPEAATSADSPTGSSPASGFQAEGAARRPKHRGCGCGGRVGRATEPRRAVLPRDRTTRRGGSRRRCPSRSIRFPSGPRPSRTGSRRDADELRRAATRRPASLPQASA
jgi:hypothetical protein